MLQNAVLFGNYETESTFLQTLLIKLSVQKKGGGVGGKYMSSERNILEVHGVGGRKGGVEGFPGEWKEGIRGANNQGILLHI